MFAKFTEFLYVVLRHIYENETSEKHKRFSDIFVGTFPNSFGIRTGRTSVVVPIRVYAFCLPFVRPRAENGVVFVSV